MSQEMPCKLPDPESYSHTCMPDDYTTANSEQAPRVVQHGTEDAESSWSILVRATSVLTLS